jgi:hypothetical protein
MTVRMFFRLFFTILGISIVVSLIIVYGLLPFIRLLAPPPDASRWGGWLLYAILAVAVPAAVGALIFRRNRKLPNSGAKGPANPRAELAVDATLNRLFQGRLPHG